MAIKSTPQSPARRGRRRALFPLGPPPPTARLRSLNGRGARAGGRDRRPPSLYVARPSKSGWGIDNGDAAFLLGVYDKVAVVEGVARAAKKAASLSSPPSSESPPGGRGARGCGLEGQRGGEGGRDLLPGRRMRTRVVQTATGPRHCRCARVGGVG